MITAQYIFISFFFITLIYAFIRPFSSLFSKFFLIGFSLIGIVIVFGEENTTIIANSIGIGRGSDLLLYLLILCFFLFSFYSLNRFSELEKNLAKLAQATALLDKKIRDDSKN